MAKWQLKYFDGNKCPNKSGNTLVLECTDMGVIEEVDLGFWINNSPYYAGQIKADGITFYGIEGKTLGLVCHMGIQLDLPKNKLYCLSENQMIDIKDSRDEKMIPKAQLEEYLRGRDVELWISDHRVILLALYTVLQDKERIKKKSTPFPTREEAIKILSDYGAYHPFSPVELIGCGYDVINKMCDDWENEFNKPDEKFYTFVQNIGVAGTFTIKNRYYVLKGLSVGDHCRLEREPENPHDANAIKIYASGERLGYVPRADAEKLAPVMDHEACLVGRISSVNPGKGEVFVDLYKRKQIPIDSITSIHFECGSFFSGGCSFDLNFRTRKIISKRSLVPFDVDTQVVEMTIAPEHWNNFALPLLRRCNFLAWRKNYEANNVEDGDCWYMKIRQGTGKQIKINGYNCYPEEWSFWKNFMDECFDLRKIKGNGGFYIEKTRRTF